MNPENWFLDISTASPLSLSSTICTIADYSNEHGYRIFVNTSATPSMPDPPLNVEIIGCLSEKELLETYAKNMPSGGTVVGYCHSQLDLPSIKSKATDYGFSEFASHLNDLKTIDLFDFFTKMKNSNLHFQDFRLSTVCSVIANSTKNLEMVSDMNSVENTGENYLNRRFLYLKMIRFLSDIHCTNSTGEETKSI